MIMLDQLFSSGTMKIAELNGNLFVFIFHTFFLSFILAEFSTSWTPILVLVKMEPFFFKYCPFSSAFLVT